MYMLHHETQVLLVAYLAVVSLVPSSPAKMDLVTLPARDTVQLTIYNSADMTLVRERRALTLQKGDNHLQFSWANTLIDPTSLEMLAKAQADKIEIQALTYPPRVQNLGVWNITSEVSGEVPVEITYLTSGLSWRAFYMGTLSADEAVMKLEGYVRVENQSGEDYENAQTRLIVGQVHMLDEIAMLARRQYPYGVPAGYGAMNYRERLDTSKLEMEEAAAMPMVADALMAMNAPLEKRIVKEGLSEYFLYTIEGTETIPHGWAKRLPSFNADAVPVENLYKYEEERYGEQVLRFLSFKNDKDHKLGETPIPGGNMEVYRLADKTGHLSYEGQSEFKYIPVDEDVELNLGPVLNVVVEPKLMDIKTGSFMFDRDGNISGWDETRTFKIEVKNTREVGVKVEIQRNFGTPYWSLEKTGEFGEYEKVDVDTAKFTLSLKPRSKAEFQYVLTTRLGQRTEQE